MTKLDSFDFDVKRTLSADNSNDGHTNIINLLKARRARAALTGASISDARDLPGERISTWGNVRTVSIAALHADDAYCHVYLSTPYSQFGLPDCRDAMAGLRELFYGDRDFADDSHAIDDSAFALFQSRDIYRSPTDWRELHQAFLPCIDIAYFLVSPDGTISAAQWAELVFLRNHCAVQLVRAIVSEPTPLRPDRVSSEFLPPSGLPITRGDFVALNHDEWTPERAARFEAARSKSGLMRKRFRRSRIG